MATQLDQAKRAIRAGFFAALFSLGMTLLITVLGATGTADLGLEADWYMLFDVGLIALFAIGLWFKSRTAATLMFIYFLVSKILMWVDGNSEGMVMSFVFLYFYGHAMIASFRYHHLIDKNVPDTEVF